MRGWPAIASASPTGEEAVKKQDRRGFAPASARCFCPSRALPCSPRNTSSPPQPGRADACTFRPFPRSLLFGFFNKSQVKSLRPSRGRRPGRGVFSPCIISVWAQTVTPGGGEGIFFFPGVLSQLQPTYDTVVVSGVRQSAETWISPTKRAPR